MAIAAKGKAAEPHVFTVQALSFQTLAFCKTFFQVFW